MNMKKIIITLVVLSAFLFVFLFVSEKMFNKTIVDTNNPSQDIVLPIMDIKEQYKGSTYTFAGTIDLPTPCHQLDTKVNQISDAVFEIEMNIVAPAQDIMCAQVIAPTPYNVSFEGPSDILIYAKLDGEIYELSRFVIPEGEDINTFELFIKG